MPKSFKGLFNAYFLKEEMTDFKKAQILDYNIKCDVIRSWHEEIDSGKIASSKEEEVKPRFLIDIFGKVLGYNINDPKNWNLVPELKTIVDGTKADAGLGIFEMQETGEKKQKIFAVIEIKDFNTDLDKPNQKEKSAVEQGFDYSLKTGAKWVIVSNMKEIRLYDSHFIGRYEVFYLSELLQEEHLLKFIYLMEKTGLIHTQRSRLEKLLERNENYTPKKRPKKTKEDHIIDELYNALHQFDGLEFIDSSIISNIYPFNILDDYVWHTRQYSLFTINPKIYKLLVNTELKNGTIVLSKSYENEVEKSRVKNYIIKLEYVFNKLNKSLIFTVKAVRNYKEVEAKRTRPGYYGFSIRNEFHFDDLKDGINKNIVLRPSEWCDCIVCRFRTLNFKKIIRESKHWFDDTPTLDKAYGLYLLCSDNFYDSYKLYKNIISKSHGVPNKKIANFLGYYNLKLHHNLIEIEDREIIGKIHAYTATIDLEEILWNNLDSLGLKKIVRDVLRNIRDHKLFQEINAAVAETERELQKAKTHYESGGTYIAIPNYTFKYVYYLDKISVYCNANYLIADTFSNYSDIICRIFSGLVTTQQLRKYPYRLESFFCGMLIEVILNVKTEDLYIVLKRVQFIEIKESELNALLARLTNFLASAIVDTPGSPQLDSIFSKHLSNYRFREKCRRIFANYFIILSKVNCTNDCWNESIGNTLVNFLQIENFLVWYHMEKLVFFLNVNGQLFTYKQLTQIIYLANERNTQETNKYQKILSSSCNALHKCFPDFKITDSDIVRIATANAKGNSGNYKYLIDLWKIVDCENQNLIKDTIDAYLDNTFDPELYEKLLKRNIYQHEYRTYFTQLVVYTKSAKGKGFVGIKDGIPEYDDLIFENFALVIYILNIPFDDVRLKLFDNLSPYEMWLMNPFQFDYTGFDSYWLLAASNSYFLNRLKDVSPLRDALHCQLKSRYHKELAEIYFKYFCKLP